MNWVELGCDIYESDDGYLVSGVIVGIARWAYMAYGPMRPVTKDNGRVYFLGVEYKERYRLGEEVPPAYDYKKKAARAFIACRHSWRCGGRKVALMQARKACEQEAISTNQQSGGDDDINVSA